MNETQTVFAIFFAIFWGAVANVQPRWKAFQLPLIEFAPVRRRVLLSVTFFNLLPLLFFGWTLWILVGPAASPINWTGWTVARLVLRGVIPAIATFGFYRLWLGIVECHSSLFYVETQAQLPQKYQRRTPESQIIEPSLQELGIKQHTGSKNIRFGLGFVVLAILMPLVIR